MAFSNISIGDNAPDFFYAIIENPKGSHLKYEYDKNLDEIKLDRILHGAVFFPNDYGFIPQTTAEDGDPLDVMVIITEPLFPGCIVYVRPIGVLDMDDEKGKDWKIIAIVNKDPEGEFILDINDLKQHQKHEIERFFRVYKQLENKIVTVKGWMNKDAAYRIINTARMNFANIS